MMSINFFSELKEISGLVWHPDHPFDTLRDIPRSVEVSPRVTSLMRSSSEICETAGVEDPYELAYTSTRKIKEPHGIGTEIKKPSALLFV